MTVTFQPSALLPEITYSHKDLLLIPYFNTVHYLSLAHSSNLRLKLLTGFLNYSEARFGHVDHVNSVDLI